jgi:hypothetical protein
MLSSVWARARILTVSALNPSIRSPTFSRLVQFGFGYSRTA